MKAASENNGIYDRVAGRLRYAFDDEVSGCLYGAFVRSTVAHGRVRKIDLEAASSMPGVEKILSAADFEGGVPRYGVMVADQPILADGTVRYYGEPVCLVLADSMSSAVRAAEMVSIEYDEYPCIVDPEAAVADGCPVIADTAHPFAEKFRGTNVNSCLSYSWGEDVDTLRAGCHFVTKGVYRVPFAHHSAIETYGCLAIPAHDGVILKSAIQSPFQLQRVVADMLGIPVSRIQVKASEIGGGFGGRGYPKMEVIAAYIAYRYKKPVKLAFTAHEGFLIAQREAAVVRVETGFDASGHLVFQDVDALYGIGAYTDISPRVVGKAGMLATGAYKTPSARIRVRGVYTNTVPTTAFRGFGATHISFALEGQFERAARALGLTSLGIRLLNLPERGEVIIPLETPVDGIWKESVARVAKEIGLEDPAPAGHFRGIGIGIKNSIAATIASARLRLKADGSAVVYSGTTEMGQGARGVMTSYVERFLTVSAGVVHVVSGDTEQVPFDFITASSRSSVSMGWAIKEAARQIEAELYAIAGRCFGDPGASLESGSVICASGARYTFTQLLDAEFGKSQGELEALGTFRGIKDPRHPLGGPCTFYEFVAAGVELSVDKETGEVKVHRLINVCDAGRIISPTRAEGVDEGGLAMGLGLALHEFVAYDNRGIPRNASSLDYRIPTSVDCPSKLESIFIENGDGAGPSGEKGIGEGGILAVAPAIAEAIRACTGVELFELPFTAERIWRSAQALPKQVE